MTQADTVAERRLLRHTALTMAWQAAVAVAGLVVGVMVIVAVWATHDANRDAQEVVRTTAQRVDDVADPPAGVWVLTPSGAATAGTPVPLRRAALSTRPTWTTRLPGPYVMAAEGQRWTAQIVARPDGERFLVVADPAPYTARAHRLLEGTVAGGVLGVVGSALLGWAIGRRAVRPLGRALNLQRRFVTDASHELRTPLTVISTRAQLVRHRAGDALSERTSAELDRLVLDVTHMADVIDDLLESATIAAGARPRAPVDLADLATSVVDSLRVVAAERDVWLGVSPVRGPAQTLGHRTALERAVTVLVDNALHHVAPGGEVRLEVETENRGGSVVVRVVDDGQGLAHPIGPRPSRFGHGSSPAQRHGIGLALAHEIASSHSGRLTVTPRTDGRRGTVASLTLPAAAPPDDSTADPAEAESAVHDDDPSSPANE